MQQVLTHFRGQQGTALAFTLPAAVYAGWTDYAAEIPLTQKWRYAGPPEVEFVAPGIVPEGLTGGAELIGQAI